MLRFTPLLLHTDGLRLKAECLQPGGSYKIRGVRRFFERKITCPGGLELLRGGVSTVSAGNLGRSLAAEAQSLGIPCTIFVPDSAPFNKKQKILSYGAVLEERPFAEIFRMVHLAPLEPNFLHPLRTPELLEGYGEIAHEVLAEHPETEVIVAPFGLGGLALGIARALQEKNSSATVVAAELDLCAPLGAALSAGGPVKIERISSFVDAIGTAEVLPNVFEEAKDLLAGSISVSIGETRQALLELQLRQNLRVEGASAVALAAGKKLARLSPGSKIVVILSGANIDLEVFERETHAARLGLSDEHSPSALPTPL